MESTSGLHPSRGALEQRVSRERAFVSTGGGSAAIADWEERHGYQLPHGLQAWLRLSNGLFGGGPYIHPITAIGPMVPFARVPGMVVQPESWFELGNPNRQTICIDLAYRLPGGSYPIFTSGDDEMGSPPRIIARSFEEWFLELLRQRGGNTGSIPASGIWATRGNRIAGMLRSHCCRPG